MVSYLRPLFKLGYKALQGARNVPKDFGPATRLAYEKNPYIQKYMGMMGGKEGWKKGAAAWWASSAALDAASDFLPERVQEETSTWRKRKTGIAEEGGADYSYPKTKPKPPTITPDIKEDKNKTVAEEEKKLKQQNEGTGTKKKLTGDATLNATDSSATDNIESDSVTRVKAYKDIIRQFIGSGEEGERMQKAALLMNIGGMMMAGRSDDPGMRGFVDIIGQTAMQTAPLLFQMGVEKGKSEREIGQAALQLYISQLDDDKRTGDFVSVWQNEYEVDADKNIVYDRLTGAPVGKGRLLAGQYRANSPEMEWFLDMNNQLQYPFYTFQPSSGTAAGLSGVTTPGSGMTTFKSKAGQDSMIKYARYIKGPIDAMAQSIIPMMIERRDTLIGIPGFFRRELGPPAYLATEFARALKTGFGPNAVAQISDDEFQVNRTSELGKYFDMLTPGTTEGNEYDKANEENPSSGNTYAVMQDGTPGEFIEIQGKKLPVYIDTRGQYGVAGASYLTRGALSQILFDPRSSELEIFETTLGLALARKRQPTGRMLADVLKRSFENVKMTDFAGGANMPEAVIGKYISLYNELYDGMTSALESAGYVPTDADRTEPWHRVSDWYDVKGAKEMANQYYLLRRNEPSYSEYSDDIHGVGIPTWTDYVGGNAAVVGVDNAETDSSWREQADYYRNLLEEIKFGRN